MEKQGGDEGVKENEKDTVATVEPNEPLDLELPRPWVSLGSAFAHRCGEGIRPNLGLLIRNQGKAK